MTRIGIAALVFMMAQAVLFGAGTILVLCTPMADPRLAAERLEHRLKSSWWEA